MDRMDFRNLPDAFSFHALQIDAEYLIAELVPHVAVYVRVPNV